MTDSKDVRKYLIHVELANTALERIIEATSAAVSPLSDISEERVIPAYRSIHRDKFHFSVKTTKNATQIKRR